MSLAALDSCVIRPAEPGSAAASRRWRQEPARSGLSRTGSYRPRPSRLPPLPAATQGREA